MTTDLVNYNGRTFRSTATSPGGDVDAETIFSYHQDGTVVWAEYHGGAVHFGTLIAIADRDCQLDMRYQHIARDGTFKSGRCVTRPERLTDGRLRLHETWQWTDGAEGTGASIVEEVRTSDIP